MAGKKTALRSVDIGHHESPKLRAIAVVTERDGHVGDLKCSCLDLIMQWSEKSLDHV